MTGSKIYMQKIWYAGHMKLAKVLTVNRDIQITSQKNDWDLIFWKRL